MIRTHFEQLILFAPKRAEQLFGEQFFRVVDAEAGKARRRIVFGMEPQAVVIGDFIRAQEAAQTRKRRSPHNRQLTAEAAEGFVKEGMVV